MIAPAVSYLGEVRIDLAVRPMLDAARAALERGAVIEGGCRLREAIRLYLKSLCEFHRCSVLQKKWKAPIELARALRRQGVFDRSDLELITAMLDNCNRAAHLQEVDPAHLANSALVMGWALDGGAWLAPQSAGRRRP